MSIISFGEWNKEHTFKVLDERVVRGSSGILLLLGIIALVNGFVMKNYPIIPYISGFFVINFAISVFINPKFAPTTILAKFLARKQTPLYIGAVQKRFSYTLGLILTLAIFIMSLQLLKDATWFDSVCGLCVICNLFMYLETAFGICVGCKIYNFLIKVGIVKNPEVRPNCMGDSCQS